MPLARPSAAAFVATLTLAATLSCFAQSDAVPTPHRKAFASSLVLALAQVSRMGHSVTAVTV